jgi:hypothetical protein
MMKIRRIGKNLEHAVADRERVIRSAARAITGRRDAIGQMPRPELIGVRRACREPQLELALGLARQMTGPLRVGLGSDDDGSTLPVGRKLLCLIYCQPRAWPL